MGKKALSLFLILLILSSSVTGCYDATEIDDEVYAISVGVDRGVSNKVRLTVEFPLYAGGSSESGSSSGTGGGSAQEKSTTHTIEAPSILEAVNMYNMATSRKVSLMHAKWYIFSEEFAREDIGSYIAGLERFRETRSTTAIIVTRGSAENFIRENKSLIGQSISKSAELLVAKSGNTGYFPQVRFIDFYRSLFSPSRSPITMYGGVNKFENLNSTTASSLSGERQGHLPGELPRASKAGRELSGMAVFDGGRMIGSLDNLETSFYLIVVGKYKGGRMSIPDKNSPGDVIIVGLNNSRNPKITACFKNGEPAVDALITLDAEIYGIQSRFDYEALSRQGELESMIKEYLLDGINRTIKKTQELNADIFGFGESMAGNFFTITEWENYNWLSHYKESSIQVSLEVNVRRMGLIYRSAPIFNTAGKED